MRLFGRGRENLSRLERAELRKLRRCRALWLISLVCFIILVLYALSIYEFEYRSRLSPPGSRMSERKTGL